MTQHGFEPCWLGGLFMPAMLTFLWLSHTSITKEKHCHVLGVEMYHDVGLQQVPGAILGWGLDTGPGLPGTQIHATG